MHPTPNAERKHATPPKLLEISNEFSYPGALAPALGHQRFPFSGTRGVYRRALVVLTRPDRYKVDAEVSLLDGAPARIAVIWPVHLQKAATLRTEQRLPIRRKKFR